MPDTRQANLEIRNRKLRMPILNLDSQISNLDRSVSTELTVPPVPTAAELSMICPWLCRVPVRCLSTLARTKLITSASVHSGALADVPEDGLIRNYPARGWTCRGATNATKFAKAISGAATRHDERTVCINGDAQEHGGRRRKPLNWHDGGAN